MKGNRDMFYGNYNVGAYQDGSFTPPSGYNMNTQYQAFGPNMYQSPNIAPNNTDPYNERITALERQIRNLDQRIRKLETGINTNVDTDINDSNLYMI